MGMVLSKNCGMKPTSKFKKLRRKIRRAKVKSALRLMKEIPIFKITDTFDWN